MPNQPLQIDELVEWCADRMASGVHKHALLAEIRQNLDLPEFTVNSYEMLRRKAEQLNRDRCGSPITERGNTIAFHKSIVSDEEMPMKYRLRSMEAITKILGLEHMQGGITDKAQAIRRALDAIE